MSSPLKDRTKPDSPVVPDHTDTPVAGTDGVEASVERAPGVGLFGLVWRFFISMRTGLMLILILGALTLLGTVLMQASSEALASPSVYQQWYEAGPKLRYGGWAPILSALGLFGIFSSWYFRALFVILALSILACSINRAPQLWRVATRPATSMGDAFFTKAPLHASFDLDSDVETAAEQVRSSLKKAHFRVLDGAPVKKGADLYADKFRWAPFGTVMAHLSFVIILAGFVVSATSGFKEANMLAPVGVPVEVGHGTGLTFTVQSYNEAFYDNGAPKDYMSDIVVSKNGQQVARQETRVNAPLIYDGVWFHQVSPGGVGADIKVTRAGKTLYAETVPLQWASDDGTRVYGIFEVPDAGLTVFAVQAASGKPQADLPAGTMALEIHTNRSNTPTVKSVTQGNTVTVNDITFGFDRTRQTTGIGVTRDPGSPLVWLGSALLILGSYLVFFLPHRRLWVRVRRNASGGSTVQVGAPIKRDPAFEPVFERLVSTMQAADA